MNAFTKVLVVVVLVLSAGFAVSQMLLYSKRVNYREKYEVADADLREKTQALQDREGDLQRTVRQRDELKAKKDAEILDLNAQLGTKDLETVKLNREKEGLQASFNEERIRVNNLEERIDGKDELIAELKGKVEDLDGSLKGYMAAVERLEGLGRQKDLKIEGLDKQIARLEGEKREITQEKEEYELVLRDLALKGFYVEPGPPVPVIHAKVSRVDNDLGTVVLNKGKNDLVKVNFSFTVYRGADFIAKVYMMDVYNDHSLARVDRALEHLPMTMGDDATTRRGY